MSSKKHHSKSEVFFEEIPSSIATFKSGINKPIHRWFRLTPSFGADLVGLILKELEHEGNEVVFDPYAGASTTLIECKLKGIQSFGFEVNPLLYFIGKTSLHINLKADDLKIDFNKILNSFKRQSKKYLDCSVEQIDMQIPSIHNPFRWWRKDVLKDLLLLKKAIQRSTISDEHKDFFLMSLAAVLVPDLTNVTLGKLQLHFINRDNDTIDVIKTFSEHTKKMITDLSLIGSPKIKKTISELFLTDSTNPNNIVPSRKADIVITSPPYPNRYSYVWNTRPHLFFLDLFSSPQQSSSLDLKSVGGTWGTATSILMKGEIQPKFKILKKVVLPVVLEIREKDNLMANYVMKYFNSLTEQIIAMDQFLSNDVRVAYVVGCSEIKGVRVETDVLLSQIFKGLGLGYNRTKVHQFRRRNSGKDLFESIVYAWKS